MDLTQRTETFTQDDPSWLASEHGTSNGFPLTLQANLFTSGTHYPSGFLKSGIVLGKVTATGLYGPYGASPNEVQTLTFDATGGVYAIGFDGAVAAANATYLNTSGDTAALTAHLETLENINPGDVVVTRGTPAGNVTVFSVEFTGQYLGENVPQLTNTETLTGGGASLVHATTVVGGGAIVDGREVARAILLTPVALPATVGSGTKPNGTGVDHVIVRASQLIGLDDAARADLTSVTFR